jgi:hypothetical protein
MTKNWLGDTCVLGVFALLFLVLPVVGQGADRKSVDESVNTQTQTGRPEASDIEKRLDQIDSDLETVLGEQDRIKEQLKRNRLQWSGSLRVTGNNFHTVDNSIIYNQLMGIDLDAKGPKFAPPASQHLVRDYGSAWVSRLRLTMSYDITEKLRFYGQIVGYKYYNATKVNPYLLDQVGTRYPLDSSIRVERAYFDWFINDWITFSAGRMSSPEGPPAELKENTERNATWGVQMVEAAMDSIMLTLNLSKLIDSTYLRLSYMPFSTFADARKDNDLFSNEGFKDMHSYAALYEMKIPYIGSNVFQLGFSITPQFRPRNNGIFFNKETNNQVINDKPDDPIYPDKTKLPEDLGSYTTINTLLELKDILGTGLDIFGSYAMTILNPTYKYEYYNIPIKSGTFGLYSSGYKIVDYTEANNPSAYASFVPSAKAQALAGMFPNPSTWAYPVGLASADDPEKGAHLGHFVYVGLRYSPPETIWSFFRDYPFRIGFEYNRGTKYHFIFSSPSDLLINKLGTKGNVYELYLIQQLVTNHLFIRLGYVFIERQYTGSYLGPTIKVNQLIHNIYALVDASW